MKRSHLPVKSSSGSSSSTAQLKSSSPPATLPPRVMNALRQSGVNQQASRRAAPPVYRPNPTPTVLQAKMSAGQQPQTAPTNRATQAPSVYRPQPVPRVLQLKAATGQQPQTIKPSRPPAHRPTPMGLNHGVVQRMEGPSGNSGRDAGVIWDLFSGYSEDRAERVTAAFLTANYAFGSEMKKAIRRAITELKIDVAAHGKGDNNSGKQGNYEETAINFESKLIAWASQHPKTGGSKGKSGLEHNEGEKQKAVASKQNEKSKKIDAKHQKWHLANPNAPNPCPLCL